MLGACEKAPGSCWYHLFKEISNIVRSERSVEIKHIFFIYDEFEEVTNLTSQFAVGRPISLPQAAKVLAKSLRDHLDTQGETPFNIILLVQRNKIIRELEELEELENEILGVGEGSSPQLAQVFKYFDVYSMERAYDHNVLTRYYKEAIIDRLMNAKDREKAERDIELLNKLLFEDAWLARAKITKDAVPLLDDLVSGLFVRNEECRSSVCLRLDADRLRAPIQEIQGCATRHLSDPTSVSCASETVKEITCYVPPIVAFYVDPEKLEEAASFDHVLRALFEKVGWVSSSRGPDKKSAICKGFARSLIPLALFAKREKKSSIPDITRYLEPSTEALCLPKTSRIPKVMLFKNEGSTGGSREPALAFKFSTSLHPRTEKEYLEAWIDVSRSFRTDIKELSAFYVVSEIYGSKLWEDLSKGLPTNVLKTFNNYLKPVVESWNSAYNDPLYSRLFLPPFVMKENLEGKGIVKEKIVELRIALESAIRILIPSS